MLNLNLNWLVQCPVGVEWNGDVRISAGNSKAGRNSARGKTATNSIIRTLLRVKKLIMAYLK